MNYFTLRPYYKLPHRIYKCWKSILNCERLKDSHPLLSCHQFGLRPMLCSCSTFLSQWTHKSWPTFSEQRTPPHMSQTGKKNRTEQAGSSNGCSRQIPWPCRLIMITLHEPAGLTDGQMKSLQPSAQHLIVLLWKCFYCHERGIDVRNYKCHKSNAAKNNVMMFITLHRARH